MGPLSRTLTLALALALSAANAADPATTLKQADWTREVAQAGLTVRVKVDDGKEAMLALVRTSGENLRIDVEGPAARVGEVLLYAGGRWWFCKPGLRRPAPVSAGQAFGARAASADLVLLLEGLSEDYKPVSETTETLDGVSAQRLDLEAVTSAAAWPRLQVWLTGQPAQIVRVAVVDGKGAPSRVAKVTWGQTVAQPTGARPFPSKVTLEDGQGKLLATLTYEAPTPGPLAAELFDPAKLATP